MNQKVLEVEVLIHVQECSFCENVLQNNFFFICPKCKSNVNIEHAITNPKVLFKRTLSSTNWCYAQYVAM